MGASTDKRRHWLGFQALASVLVLGLLLRDAEVERVRGALSEAHLGWLFVATLVKAAGLTLHETRVWVTLLAWQRTSFRKVLMLGYAAGLLNGILPARGGDLVAAAMIRTECGVPSTVAVAAVVITGFIEALLFGVFLLFVMALGVAHWEEVLGAARAADAFGLLTIGTFVAITGAVAVVLVTRRLRRDETEERPPGPLSWIRRALMDAGQGLSARGPLLANLALAVLHVLVVVGCFVCLFPAMGQVPPSPVAAACGIIAVGSLAGIVLPPSFGAGPAATAVFVLAFFGIDEAHALAYAALNWVSNTLPPLVLGIVPLWVRLGRLPSYLEGAGSEGGGSVES